MISRGIESIGRFKHIVESIVTNIRIKHENSIDTIAELVR